MSIDRINVDGNYEPSNCRWLSQAEQVNNTRRNRFITINGATKTVTQWAREKGINPALVICRLHRNWDEVRSFEKPEERNK